MSTEGIVSEVELICQGTLCKLKVRGPGRAGGGKRGVITGFSPASRLRLFELIARLRPTWNMEWPKFITLTYPDPFPTVQVSKKHLNHFGVWLRRYFPKAWLSAIWRLEPQLETQRWAPHFHLMLFGCPYLPFRVLQSAWGKIIELPSPFVNVEGIHSFQELRGYVGKYIGKTSETLIGEGSAATAEGGGAAPSLLDNSAYLNNGWDKPGRIWGIWGEQNLPFAPGFTVDMLGGHWLADYRRIARKQIEKSVKHPRKGPVNKEGGVTLLRPSEHQAEEWARLAIDMQTEEVKHPVEVLWQHNRVVNKAVRQEQKESDREHLAYYRMLEEKPAVVKASVDSAVRNYVQNLMVSGMTEEQAWSIIRKGYK